MKLQKSASLLLLGSSVVIGVVTDILIRQNIFGLNFLLWTMLWAGILLTSLYSKSKLSYRSAIYAGFAIVNALMVYIRAEPVVQVWSVLSTLAFIALLFSASYLDNFFALPLIKRFLEYVSGSVMSLLIVIGAMAKTFGANQAPKPVKTRITIGVLVAIVLSLMFIGLFSSADQVFRQNFQWIGDALTSLGDWLNNFNIGRIVTVSFWVAVAFGWLAMAITRNTITNTDEIKLVKFLSLRDSQIILSSVAVVFAVFVFVQLRFLFGGATLPDGIGYADYARSGYGQLLLATMLASGVVYLTKNTTKTSHAKRTRWLPSILLLLNAVVVLSAWKRLSLYESAYGWTMTRFVARMGLVCIMAGIVYLLVWVVGKLSNRQVFSASWYTLASVLLISAALNPIGMITQRNIVDLPNREVALDIPHLTRQSPDSYAALCKYAPSLKQNFPQELENLTMGYLARSDGEYVVRVEPVNYPTKLNSGLAAHYTRSHAFADKHYYCL